VLARRRLLPFVQKINPRYLPGWVHEDICRRLERFSRDVEEGKSPRLMLLMPPRHGKSELASRMFPAWHLGRCPDHEIIACSYNVSLAMSFSRKVKEVLQDPVYQAIFDTRLHPDFQAAEEWGVQGHRGGYVAAGVGGGITGKGAHVLVIDDPIKNAEEADSADLREKLWDWYGSTAYTRLAPGGGVLVIQTWWHDDDLAGKLQLAMADDEADQFEVVKYPAIAEADEWLDPTTDEIVRIAHSDPRLLPGPDDDLVETSHAEMLRAIARAAGAGYDPATMKFLRPRGEALHPARYDVLKLNRIKKTLPVRFWSALYQQNPVPDDGNYFTKDMFRRGKLPPASECYVQIAWDFAISEKTHNDYTVGTVTLLDSDDMLWVADRVKFRSADADFIVKSIVRLSRKWYSPSQILGCEDGQIYRALSALLSRELKKERVFPSLQLLKPITDKQARGRTLQGRMQQGLVTYTDQGDWYDDHRATLLRFPSGVHDDDVDSLGWNAIIAAGRQPPKKPEKKRLKSWKDRINDAGGGGHMAA
jgi:predicted phage terminase large subunit-like protein